MLIEEKWINKEKKFPVMEITRENDGTYSIEMTHMSHSGSVAHYGCETYAEARGYMTEMDPLRHKRVV